MTNFFHFHTHLELNLDRTYHIFVRKMKHIMSNIFSMSVMVFEIVKLKEQMLQIPDLLCTPGVSVVAGVSPGSAAVLL
jgi:hypothetical protein